MTATRFRVGAVMALAVGGLALAPAANAEPTLQVDKKPVQAGDSVKVSLAGLPPNLPMVTVGQCKAQVVAPTDCSLPTALMGAADATGVWQANEGKDAITLAPQIGGVDCASAAGACTLAVTSLTNPSSIITSLPLDFGAAEDEPAATPEAAAADEDDSGNTPFIIGAAVVVVVVAGAGAAVFLRRRSGTS
ncbi:neocarzinostatin apoprotein domain-containing protein [Nocardia shimofusensis]|uniref:neocarzinostatin apoprotein domain-containing protein n=1 Tax=Nocardia shimofusensis TaxID=228596 RepID=UPI000AE472A5|nr:neocarzinostatin apoprotein domain-containing protein [Nocardia shimofusensis]